MTKMIVFLVMFGVPQEEIPLQTTHSTSFVIYPTDTQHYGTLFGGKILAEMDRCAGITVRRLLYASPVKDAVTVALTNVTFKQPGNIKDLVFVSGKVVNLGEKSIDVQITVEKEIGYKREIIAEGLFVFVSYDVENKQSKPHGLKLQKP